MLIRQKNVDQNTSRKYLYFNYLFPIHIITYPGDRNHVLYRQTQSNLNRAGETYAVEVEVCNEGIPLADQFAILGHICLQRVAPSEAEDPSQSPTGDWCRYSCHANIKYKKQVWGMFKGNICSQARFKLNVFKYLLLYNSAINNFMIDTFFTCGVHPQSRNCYKKFAAENLRIENFALNNLSGYFFEVII